MDPSGVVGGGEWGRAASVGGVGDEVHGGGGEQRGSWSVAGCGSHEQQVKLSHAPQLEVREPMRVRR